MGAIAEIWLPPIQEALSGMKFNPLGLSVTAADNSAWLVSAIQQLPKSFQ